MKTTFEGKKLSPFCKWKQILQTGSCLRTVRIVFVVRINILASWAIQNKSLRKQRTHKITKIGDSVWLSLFICNTVVCEAAYAPLRRLKWYSIFKITRMGSIIPKEIKYNLHYDDVRGDKMQSVKNLIRLRDIAAWSEFSLGAHVL